MACASFCPRMENIDGSPVGIKILVDCSGSMRGISRGQAVKGLKKILTLLTPEDFVSYSRFGSKVEHFTSSMLPCKEECIAKLSAKVDSTQADMGGIRMEAAILSTVKDIANTGDAPPLFF